MSGRAIERDYVDWLQQESMPRGAAVVARWLGRYVGETIRPLKSPGRNREGVRLVHGLPHSMITRTGESFLRTLAGEDLWRVFEAIGVNAVHTGPVSGPVASLAGM